jgi:hypothetical protein
VRILKRLGEYRLKGQCTNYERILALFTSQSHEYEVSADELSALFPDSAYAPNMVATSIRELNKKLVNENLRIVHKSSYLLVEMKSQSDLSPEAELQVTR